MSVSRMQNAWIAAVAALALCVADATAYAETLRAGGTGSSIETLRRLGAAFAKIEPDTRIEVVEGLGSSGGIAAVAAGAIDFSISGRQLRANEDRSLKGLIFARTPFGLASSRPSPGEIRAVDVSDLFGSATSVWPDGKPVRVVLRPKSETDSLLLTSLFPNMADVVEGLRQRTEIPVAVTDQDNARIAQELPGSLTTMSLAQLQTENLRLNFLTIDGVAPTLENYQSGKYPYGKEAYLVVSSRERPALDRFVAFVRSSAGVAVLRENGSLPVGP